MKNKEYKHFNKEVKVIPEMIKIYCHGKHKTKKGELCKDCQELTYYSLFRLDKCPFKKNKNFCSFCKIHCYKEDMRKKMKEVMRYSGPRIIFKHPIFAISHVIEGIKHKRKGKNK